MFADNIARCGASILLASTVIGFLARPAGAAGNPAPDSPPPGRQAMPVAGSDQMPGLMRRLQDVLDRTHRGLLLQPDLRGSSTAIDALAAGVAPVSVLGRIAWAGEREGFKQITGRPPVGIRIGYAGFGPDSRSRMPPAVFVNAANPVRAATMQGLARIFTAGQPAGDLSVWSQVGADGALRDRRIHVYGARDDGRTITALRLSLFGEQPNASRYEALADDKAVLAAVASDAAAIALVGWVAPDAIPAGVRPLPIAEDVRSAPFLPTHDDVASGHYPIRQFLWLYVDAGPGHPLPSAVRSLLDAALSAEGQAAIHGDDRDSGGFLPLSAADLALERATLRRIETASDH